MEDGLGEICVFLPVEIHDMNNVEVMVRCDDAFRQQSESLSIRRSATPVKQKMSIIKDSSIYSLVGLKMI